MLKTKSKRNGKIEFLRFVFAIMIMLVHSKRLIGTENCPFNGMSFAVEFFFLVSGYLMMGSIVKKMQSEPVPQRIGTETMKFIKNKIISILPEHIISWIIGFIFVSIAMQKSLYEIAKYFINLSGEWSLLQMSGINNSSMNVAIWYISSMLLCMFILYPLIRKYYDSMYNIVMPLGIVLILGYLCQNGASLRNPTLWMGMTFKGNLRALVEIALGAECYCVADWLRKKEIKKYIKVLLTLTEIALYLSVICYMLHGIIAYYDYFFLFIFATAITITFSNQTLFMGLFDNSFVAFLGKFSTSIFFSHYVFARRLNEVLPNDMSNSKKWVVYFACTFITATVVYILSKWIRSCIKKRKSVNEAL